LDLVPFAGKILAAFVSGLTDRNAAVRKTYASAIGQLMTVAKSSSLEKLFVKLRVWYLEKDDDASRYAVAYTFEAVNRHNPDKMKAHGSQNNAAGFLGHARRAQEGRKR
jgi:proteasome component ECM29